MGLRNDDNPGGITAGDLVTHVDQFQADTAIDRGGDAAPVKLQLGAGDAGFIGFDRPLRFVHQCLLSIQFLTGDQIGFHQLLIAGQIATGICQRRGIFG
ncbi:hypothetical protein D3C81_1849410 [compost metagenome]